MSDNKLMSKIAIATINPAHANRLEKYADAHAIVFRANAARNAKMMKWDNEHDYKAAAKLARGKNVKAADVKEYERLKNARADFADIVRAEYTETCRPARADMSAIMAVFFGTGKNDNSTHAAAWRNFYEKYAAYRAELSENASTPAGNAAKSAAVNMLAKCFGITFTGKLANKAGARVVNAIGVRIATMKEEATNKCRVSAMSETQCKAIVVALMLEIIEVPFNTECGARIPE